jgi:hypothetical protein
MKRGIVAMLAVFLLAAVGFTVASNTFATAKTPIAGNAEFSAYCQSEHGYYQSNWYGPTRETRAEAQADADQHNNDNPGHSAFVM